MPGVTVRFTMIEDGSHIFADGIHSREKAQWRAGTR